MLFKAARIAKICTTHWGNNPSICEWHNIGEPIPQVNSVVHLHLKEQSRVVFVDNNVHILAREDRWFERCLK